MCAMPWAEQLPEYVDNLRALLRSNKARFDMMVERQIQAQLLREMTGLRADLEPHLWALLILCLNGHEAPVPALDEAAFTAAQQSAQGGTGLGQPGPCRYPQAARALVTAMIELRQHGVYPRPKLRQ